MMPTNEARALTFQKTHTGVLEGLEAAGWQYPESGPSHQQNSDLSGGSAWALDFHISSGHDGFWKLPLSC